MLEPEIIYFKMIRTRTCGCCVGTRNSRKDLGRDSGDGSNGHSVRVADLLCTCNNVCHDNGGGSSGERCDSTGAGSNSSRTN